MAYGPPQNRKSSVTFRSGTRQRATAASTLQKYARAKAAAKARTITPAKTRQLNTQAVLSNARAIKKLQFNQWGRIQSQTSSTQGQVVLASSPVLFHVTNPMCNHHGPYLWHMALTGASPTDKNFQLYQAPGSIGMSENDETVFPNGPVMKMLSATFQFKFTGYVDDTRIRVDFFRQKRLDTDFYTQNSPDQFLPQTLEAFKNLAGFNPNQIDRAKFEILTTKYLYLNSKGSANLLDHGQDRNTTDATTPPSKYCTVHLKLNKLLKMLRPPHLEEFGQEVPQGEDSTTHHPHGSMWCYDNQHPLSNIWCLISTDDETAIASAATGDAVTVEIIRKITFQDKQ